MQRLIMLRLDVSPLIYHQQSGALSHCSNSTDLANTHTRSHRSRSQDALPLPEQITELMFSLSKSVRRRTYKLNMFWSLHC